MSSHLFDFSGFSARTDLEDEECRVLFNCLEKEQDSFLMYQNKFMSKDYKWPRDPLHTWSRLWEYPYVYYHIRKNFESSSGEKLQILDFGSGVTFFPFSVARLGCDVTCVDIDPVVAIDIPEAAKFVQHSPGTLKVELIEDGHIPIESASQDIIYCISVIEHIGDFEPVIDEMFRVLKQGGKLILTVDIDLRGNFELGPREFGRLLKKLSKYFIYFHNNRPVHPCNKLTTTNSPKHMKSNSPIFLFKQLIKNACRGEFFQGDPRVGVYLTVYSCVLIKP